MKITRTRTQRFTLAKYEHIEISAGVELDTDDYPDTDTAYAMANLVLDDALRDDIARADTVSRTPENDTYLHAWKDTTDAHPF